MGSQEGGDGGGGTSVNAAEQAKKDSLYEDRPGAKKIIRVVTVMAYMVSVSFVAIVLSGYYVFLWQPPNPRLLHRAHLQADPRIDYRVDVKPDLSKSDINERINIFREQILRNRGINITTRVDERNASVETRKIIVTSDNYIDDSSSLRRNKTFDDNSSNDYSSVTRNTIVRAFKAPRMDNLETTTLTSTSTSTTEKMTLSSIYESFNNASMTNSSQVASSGLFKKNHEINDNLLANISVESLAISRNFHKLHAKATNHSSTRPIAKETFDALDETRENNRSDDSVEKLSIRSYDSTKKFGRSVNRENMSEDGIEKLEMYEEMSDRAISGSRLPHEIREDQTIGKLDDEQKALIEIILQPNELGSHIARLPVTQLSTNDSLVSQKQTTNFSFQHNGKDIQAESSTEDVENSSERSTFESSALIVQSKSQLPETEPNEVTEKRLTQDTSDFDFI